MVLIPVGFSTLMRKVVVSPESSLLINACCFSGRIGHYFAALVEFWLRFCPALGSQKVLARQKVDVTEAGSDEWKW